MTSSRRSDLDLIVLDLDGGSALEECLASVARQSSSPSRVIIWDNGSRVPVRERLSGSADVEVFRSETNLGFAGGVNAALRKSSAPLVALVNNDVVLEPEWVSTLAGEIDRAPRVAAVQSVILRPDGLVDGAGIDLSDGTIRQRDHGRPVSELSGGAWGVSATAAIYRRAALDEVSREGAVLDERLFAWYEDVELCARLRAARWDLVVHPAALATHRGSFSAEALGGDALRLRVRNRWLVHRMHPEVGKTSALLLEDVRHLLRAVARAKPGEAMARVRAVVSGMTA